MERLAALRGQRADGTTFPIEASISRVEVGAGLVLTVIVRDITERMRVKNALLRSEQVLADFFASAPLGLMWVGPDGRVVRVNQVELALLGRPLGKVMGQPVADMHTDSAAVALLLDQLARGETVKNFRLTVAPKRGALRHLLIDANGLWTDGRFEHSRWFVRDISNRIELEAEILAIAERERGRMGHDLHDDLCQQLVAIEFQNEALISEWASHAPGSVVARAHEISAQVRHVIEHARELARGLTPTLHFAPDGLMTALQELAERTERVFQRTCRCECPVPVNIQNEAASIHLYRIAQEAVGNAIKHAKARRIDIRLAARDGFIMLGVQDDGIGIPVAPAPRKGLGIKIMQYRAGVIGGSLVVERTANGGTTIVCTVRNVRNVRKNPPPSGGAI